AQSYVGLLAPAQTPRAVLQVLEKAALAVLASANTAERINGIGMQVAEPAERTAEGFAMVLRADYERSAAAVKLAGVKAE
ncbi:MAG: tripartite tricarboxylate transporter substrate binding protein, partial [Proteobacteria bacterium]